MNLAAAMRRSAYGSKRGMGRYGEQQQLRRKHEMKLIAVDHGLLPFGRQGSLRHGPADLAGSAARVVARLYTHVATDLLREVISPLEALPPS